LSISKLPKTGVSEPEEWLSKLFFTIKESMQVSQNVCLLVSRLVDVPMVIGWLKPVVLVPVNMVSGLSNEQLKLLISHELAHVKRYDYFINLIQSLVEVFLFYHPAVKWISKQIRLDREYCCDDIAIKNHSTKIEYAKALLNAEEMRPSTIPAMAMSATGGHLKSRVSRVIGDHTCTPKYAKSGLAGLFGLIVVSLIFCSYKVVGMNQSKEVIELDKLKNKNFLILTSVEVIDKDILDKTKVEDLFVNSPNSNDSESTHKKNEKDDLNKEVKISRSSMHKKNKYDLEIVNQVNKGYIDESYQDKTKLQEKYTVPELKNISDTDTLSQAKLQEKYTVLDLEVKNISDANTRSQDNVEVLKNIEEKLPVNNKTEVILSKRQAITEYEPLIIPPKTLKMVKPIYSELAQRKGYSGDVVISFNVDLNGKATEIEFIKGTQTHLKNSVKNAIKKWRFSPGKVNGNEKVMRETKLFSFVEPNRKKITITVGSRLSSRRH